MLLANAKLSGKLNDKRRLSKRKSWMPGGERISRREQKDVDRDLKRRAGSSSRYNSHSRYRDYEALRSESLEKQRS